MRSSLPTRVRWIGRPRTGLCLDTLTAAVETLEDALLGAGWRPLANGRAWYAKRFEFAPSANRGDTAAGDLESSTRSERLLGTPGALCANPAVAPARGAVSWSRR